MSKDNIVSLLMPGGIEDSLTELLRNGARRLIQQAIEAELAEMLAKYEGQTDEQGRRAVVRNGYLPEREILTGVGPVTVKVPKVRSRGKESVVFRSSLVPPYVRKARRVEAALPWLYWSWPLLTNRSLGSLSHKKCPRPAHQTAARIVILENLISVKKEKPNRLG